MEKKGRFLAMAGALAAVVVATSVFFVGQADITEAKQPTASSPVKEKMLHTVDFFHDVQGKGTYISEDGDQLSFEFVVQEGEHPGSYVKTVDLRAQKVYEETYLDTSERIVYNHQLNYQEIRKLKPTEAKWSEARVDMLFPAAFADWMDEDPQNYSITGTELVLGRPATIIEGKMPMGLDTKFKATTFKFWVDTATGILLKSQTTDHTGHVTFSTNISELKVDQGVKLDRSMIQIPAGVPDRQDVEKAIQAEQPIEN